MLGQAELRRKKAGRSVGMAVADLAEVEEIKQVLPLFARDRKWIDDMHLQMCRIPAPTFLEARRAEWVAEQLRGLGWDAKIDRAGNVVALAGPDRGQPLVAVTAHLDTVLAPKTGDEIRAEPDGRLRGPGVSDNGAGLAALLALAKVAGRSAARDAALLLVANVCEEGEGNLNGMKHLCTKSPFAERVRHFLVLDGPNLDHITAEALACRRFEITMEGPGGHSWSDHGVPNPVHAVSRLIHNFDEARAEVEPTPRASYNFGVVEGGSSINAIPRDARTKVDLRCEDLSVLDEMAAQVAAFAQQAVQVENERSSTGKLTFRVREAGSRPGGRISRTAPLVEAVRSVDAHLGIRSHFDCASTDANIPLSMGLSALSIGAGGQGGGAHTPDEWYLPAGRELGLRRIYLAVAMMLRQVAPAG